MSVSASVLAHHHYVINETAAAVAVAEEAHRQAVRTAREAGLSWTDIGEVLGISRQAAWERFAKHM